MSIYNRKLSSRKHPQGRKTRKTQARLCAAGMPGSGYKGCPGKQSPDITALRLNLIQPHATMCHTSCSSGCQPACCVPSYCQPACCVPVGCQSSVCVPVSFKPALCVPVRCQSSVCVPVSCRPVVCVAPSCQSSGCCQPSCTSILCRPISCSIPSCC
ncbi:keratin-associated protein 12-1 [Aotus nancymaae]|uniref:keratin-associated protein 12-1 n=1 Tax=Aotus nancymaae TaxID=37293 RepID=UPI0030FEE0EA